jgi:hypothetical protein
MSAKVTDIASPWQQVADASDAIARLIGDVPGWPAYTLAEETRAELRQVAALLQRALALLQPAAEREALRYHEEEEGP